MESDFTDLLAKLVRQAEPDLDNRLESQAEALNGLKCTEPILGKWIDAHDCEYLLAAFDLDDHDFGENFPSMAHFTKDDRNQILEAFKAHFELCPHCHLKRSYDLEFDARIDAVSRQNKQQLLRHLYSRSEDSSEEGHEKIPNESRSGPIKEESGPTHLHSKPLAVASEKQRVAAVGHIFSRDN